MYCKLNKSGAEENVKSNPHYSFKIFPLTRDIGHKIHLQNINTHKFQFLPTYQNRSTISLHPAQKHDKCRRDLF